MIEIESKKEKRKNIMAALKPRCSDRNIKSARAIIQFGVIALVIWGIMYGINELEE